MVTCHYTPCQFPLLVPKGAAGLFNLIPGQKLQDLPISFLRALLACRLCAEHGIVVPIFSGIPLPKNADHTSNQFFGIAAVEELQRKQVKEIFRKAAHPIILQSQAAEFSSDLVPTMEDGIRSAREIRLLQKRSILSLHLLPNRPVLFKHTLNDLLIFPECLAGACVFPVLSHVSHQVTFLP